MRKHFLLCLIAFAQLALAACAPQIREVASVSRPTADGFAVMAASDLRPEPEYRFATLPNGMRYVIRRNANPQGTALVRLDIAAGSLDENDDERGFAHFVEHMAFNGSTRVPEGEMVRLLERHGLAFGADTNASTSFDATTYRLDLPIASRELLDTALMLMRETASELTFDPAAVARERGVVLAEMRDRNTWALRNGMAQAKFLYPGGRYPARFPIGTADALEKATAGALKAFWQREYVPAHATLVVIGDFDPSAVEAAVIRQFGSWQPAPAEPQPSAGPVEPGPGRTDIHLDSALSERIAASRHGPWLDEPDTTARRRENVLRQIGYGIVNRRLQRIARQADPPFRDAGFGTGDVFKAGRTTNLIVDTVDGKWRRGLVAAAVEYRRAMSHGFTRREVAEQVANLLTATRNSAAQAATRSHGALASAVFSLLRDRMVPASPQGSLARLEAFIPQITPASVLAALKREAVPLKDPLLRFSGRRAPAGGAPGLRTAWNEAMATSIGGGSERSIAGFPYTTFGPAGSIVSDTRHPELGIRQLRFANGVMLNIKQTDLEKGVVRVSVATDGGDMLATTANPLATQMVGMMAAGGLGKLSQDELQSVLAGRTYSSMIVSDPEVFTQGAQTTPADIELQLQVFAAMLTDPGYRAEGELRYRLDINNYFLRKDATPGSALGAAIGGILSDGDPRFSLQPVEAYRKLGFAKLRADLADRLAQGAIEVAIVGDIDEDGAVAMVARTFGALPQREAEFRPYPDQRRRPFTDRRGQRVVRHTGPADQALIQLVWPTRDDSDPVETMGLGLLERVTRLALTETLRERLGKAYSPSASSVPSRYWPGYGTFSIAASAAVADFAATRSALLETISALRDRPVDGDVLLRARQPLAEFYDNALKSNSGWMALAARAQSQADRLDRFLYGKAQLMALTAADLQSLARRYLSPEAAVEIDVLPANVPAPSAASTPASSP